MTNKIVVKMNASRVIDAIARIGYSSHSAIMDIVDNSISAGATKILIEIDRDIEKTIVMKNNIITYRIVDNGKGMGDEQIINALKLGSDANYDDNSLSKYGMGLKSAGFSLGHKLEILSKKNNTLSSLN